MRTIPRSSVMTMVGVAALCWAGCGNPSSRSLVQLDDLPPWRVVEELRIGSLHDAEAGFSSIADIELGPDSLIYVLDDQEREIRVFDQSGRRVRSFGGRGSGPGEFEDVDSFGFVGDTVWVTEMSGNRRVTLYSSDGTLLTTVSGLRTQFTGKSGRLSVNVVPGSLEAGGRLPSRYWYTAMGGSAGDTIIFPRVHFDLKGSVIDTVGWDTLTMDASPRPRLTIAGVTASRPGRPFLFNDEPIVAAQNRLHVRRALPTSGAEASINVTLLSTAGDTVWSRDYSYTPRAVSTEHVDKAVADAGEIFRLRGADSLQVDRAIREVLEIPGYVPPVTRARLVQDEIWLRREETARDWRWTILDATGSASGQITLPRTFTPLIFDKNVLWGVHTDDMDVPWVVRYRIIRQ